MTIHKTLTQRLREQDWPEAADRIEALEAALRAIIDGDQVKVGAEPIDPNDRRGHWRDTIKDGKSAKIAREALEASS